MIGPYIEAVARTLNALLEQGTRLALPLAIGAGMALLAMALLRARGRDEPLRALGTYSRHLPGILALGLCLSVGWSLLRTVPGAVQHTLHNQESAEASADPTPDAPPVYQFGPSVAAVTETTYTRTLSLPPTFLERIESDGVGSLSPYLSDPSADNILRLRDSFRRQGRAVEFTRQVTRLGEEPLALTSSQVHATFRRLEGRAYDVAFEGRYRFENASPLPKTVRFLFPLPTGGTVRDLRVQVGEAGIAEPREDGSYEWKGELRAGESRDAVVRYRALGGRLFHYDLGSRRRRVQKFTLKTEGADAVRFLRGSLLPSARDGATLRWELENVVTAQQIALTFPPKTQPREAYLQALNALGVSFGLYALGALGLGLLSDRRAEPASLAVRATLFGLGLASAPILANYVGPVAGVLLGPLIGAAVAAAGAGRRTLLIGIPSALFPAIFLSPHHSGLLFLALASLTAGGLALTRSRRLPDSPTSPIP